MHPLGIGDGKDLCHQGFKSFNDLLDKYQPKFMLHGHMHLDYAGRKNKTL
jgi:Icc-related predicted phosphoesterase